MTTPRRAARTAAVICEWRLDVATGRLVCRWRTTRVERSVARARGVAAR